MELNKIHDFVVELMYDRDKSIVGKLCENIEILDDKDSLNPELYKDIAKTVVWGEHRNFKKLLKSYFMPSIKFNCSEVE